MSGRVDFSMSTFHRFQKLCQNILSDILLILLRINYPRTTWPPAALHFATNMGKSGENRLFIVAFCNSRISDCNTPTITALQRMQIGGHQSFLTPEISVRSASPSRTRICTGWWTETQKDWRWQGVTLMEKTSKHSHKFFQGRRWQGVNSGTKIAKLLYASC